MCGIFGYSGKNFNKYKFNILGLYNDTRGGDSTGVFMSSKGLKQLKYGHDKTKLYSKFIEKGSGLDFNNIDFALGHCRKASVGGIGLTQAQPVVLKNEHGEPIFAMIHNGTLVNYKELANKYNVDFLPSETDSQIFCKTVWMAGYNVLGEYDGAGAFIFWDSRDGNNTIKVFKGASLYYQNDDELYIERPLFAMSSKDSTWISSMEESLMFINDEDLMIEEVEHNILFTILNGLVIGEDPIDRSKRKGCANLVWKAAKNIPSLQNNNYGYGNYGYNKDGYNPNEDYDYSDENEWRNAWNNKKGYKEIPFSNFEDKTEKLVFLSFSVIDRPVKPKYAWSKKVYFDEDGLYKYEGQVCDGEYNLTKAGYTDGGGSVGKRNYWFCAGVMMKSYFDYLCAQEYALRTFGEDIMDIVSIYLAKYSPTPVPLMFEDAESDMHLDVAFYSENDKGDEEEFDGIFSPYFSFTKEVYKVVDGFIREYSNYSGCWEYVQTKASLELDKSILDETINEIKLLNMIESNL